MTFLSVYLPVFILLSLQRGITGFALEDKTNRTDVTRIDGCVSCGLYRCPESTSKCLLGSVPDSCECCTGGLCAKLDGDACWNSSIPRLPSKSRIEGYCARNYLCQLRSDLQDKDDPEAICVCMEQSSACGNDNKTYPTPCALHEKAMRQKNSSLKLQHLGPCLSRPWIVSPLEDVRSDFDHRVALHCEAKGFPLPDVFWEFYSSNGHRVLKLPKYAGYVLTIKTTSPDTSDTKDSFNTRVTPTIEIRSSCKTCTQDHDEHGGTVNTSEGPEPLMRTSWLQLARFAENQVGTYHCIANNTIGEASTAAFVSHG